MTPRSLDSEATSSLPERLAALRLLLRHCQDILDPQTRLRAQAILDRTGRRLELSVEHTVVAFAGATGSGKSSLFNALTELDLATVGVMRPTTNEPLACYWGEDGADDLLGWLELPQRARIARETVLDARSQEDLHGLVLLDLPDYDSTADSHRLHVERLVPQVDAMVWVVDPQKYADAALHERYLKKLAAHSAVTIVVLNQADNLTPEQTEECVADLRQLLRSDGFGEVEVLATSARTLAGVDRLRAVLSEVVQRRAAMVARIDADLTVLAAELRAQLRADAPTGVEPEVENALLSQLAQAVGVPGIADSVAQSLTTCAETKSSWPVAQLLMWLAPETGERLAVSRWATRAPESTSPALPPVAQPHMEAALQGTARSVGRRLAPGWQTAVTATVTEAMEPVRSGLESAVRLDEPSPTRPRSWWRWAQWLQWALVAIAVVGLVWLVGAAVVGLASGAVTTPRFLGIPEPLLLLVVGLLGGIAVSVGGRALGSRQAAQAAAEISERLRGDVSAVAQQHILEPIRQILAAHTEAAALVPVVGCGRPGNCDDLPTHEPKAVSSGMPVGPQASIVGHSSAEQPPVAVTMEVRPRAGATSGPSQLPV